MNSGKNLGREYCNMTYCYTHYLLVFLTFLHFSFITEYSYHIYNFMISKVRLLQDPAEHAIASRLGEDKQERKKEEHA